MKVLTAKVIEGRLDVPAGTLEDGSTVTLLVPEAAQPGFRLSAEQNEDLALALAEADRGEGMDGWAFLEQLEP